MPCIGPLKRPRGARKQNFDFTSLSERPSLECMRQYIHRAFSIDSVQYLPGNDEWMIILGPQNFSQALGCTSPDLWKSRGNSTYVFHIRKWKDDFFYSTFMLKTKAKLTREKKTNIFFLRSDTLSVLLMIRWDWNDAIITVEKIYFFFFNSFQSFDFTNLLFSKLLHCFIYSLLMHMECQWNQADVIFYTGITTARASVKWLLLGQNSLIGNWF